MICMAFEGGLPRVWRKWKFAFVVAIIVYFAVFYWGFIFEVQREGEGFELEEPLELFSLAADPSRITAGSDLYTINITNDQEYIIQELTIEFRNIEAKAPDDFFETYTGTVTAGSEISYTNQVQAGAASLDITLDGQELVAGLTDINLYLQKEGSASEWASTGSSNDESLSLTQRDIENAGYGNYDTTVRHESGIRDVDFELTLSITYTTPMLIKTSTRELEPGQSQEFQFTLNLDQSEISELECVITGRVELPDGQDLNIVVVLAAGWDVVSFSTPIPEETADVIPWGPVDITGTSGVTLYALTIITGFVFYIRIRTKQDFSLKKTGWLHCFLSLMALMFVMAHMSTAMQKWYQWPWGEPGMIFAVAALILLTIFTVFSLFDVEFIKTLGRRKWRWVHLWLTFGLLLLIILHFGLMGDHLGFLK